MSYYKYAERDADSQINWAEVGKGLSDMLAETNRIRQEKKDALDKAQREALNYVAETPNGEHVGARTSILEYSDQVSNRLRIADQLLKSGQMSVKDTLIFRQNIVDNTNLAFNANKVYQEKYSDVMQGVRDKKYSQLYADNFAEAEGFGNWGNIGWEITPNGTVMAGKMTEQEIDGKKVRTLDKTPGSLRSMNYLNQALVGQIDFYNYEDKVNSWVDTLGKEKILTGVNLGGIQRQGKITSVEDITRREDLDPETKEVLFKFITAENDQIATIVGEPLDAARVLMDSAIFAPNKKQYSITTSEEEAKANPEKILKVVDTETGGFKYVISEQQQEDVNEFVRGQMRVKYDYEEDAQVVGAVSRDEESDAARRARAGEKEKDAAAGAWNQLYTGKTAEEKTAAADIILGTPIAKEEGLIDIDLTTEGKINLKYKNPDKNRTINYLDKNRNPISLRDFSALGVELHGVVDRDKAVKAGGGDGKFGAITDYTNIRARRQGPAEEVVEQKINIPTSAITEGSNAATETLNKLFEGTGFTANTPDKVFGNKVIITAPNGKQFQYTSKKGASLVEDIKKDIEDFVKENQGTKKRTITEIIEQDGVDFTEATKRFNAQ
jgi:hypothetical protein